MLNSWRPACRDAQAAAVDASRGPWGALLYVTDVSLQIALVPETGDTSDNSASSVSKFVWSNGPDAFASLAFADAYGGTGAFSAATTDGGTSAVATSADQAVLWLSKVADPWARGVAYPGSQRPAASQPQSAEVKYRGGTATLGIDGSPFGCTRLVACNGRGNASVDIDSTINQTDAVANVSGDDSSTTSTDTAPASGGVLHCNCRCDAGFNGPDCSAPVWRRDSAATAPAPSPWVNASAGLIVLEFTPSRDQSLSQSAIQERAVSEVIALARGVGCLCKLHSSSGADGHDVFTAVLECDAAEDDDSDWFWWQLRPADDVLSALRMLATPSVARHLQQAVAARVSVSIVAPGGSRFSITSATSPTTTGAPSNAPATTFAVAVNVTPDATAQQQQPPSAADGCRRGRGHGRRAAVIT